MKNKYVLIGLAIIIGGLLGWFIKPSNDSISTDHSHALAEQNQVWTCSMHPQIRQLNAGKCPLCGMDLIPLNASNDGADPNAITMSPTALKLAHVETMIVGGQKFEKEIRLSGKVQKDERKVYTQTSHIPGRVEQLNVTFTGERISKGQVVARVYSPDLVTAQKELFEAYSIKDEQPRLYQAAREKLINWKLTEKQIDDIINSNKVENEFPILADLSGIVLNKKVNLGDYVMRGTPIYEIADLSMVWIEFDAYEYDLTWIKVGNNIAFTIQSLPGEDFKGKISFIDPVINPETRIAKARIDFSNAGLKLKPEMFATGYLQAKLPSPDGIVIPKSAVMWTGEKSVVYTKSVSDQGFHFAMKEVILGPSTNEGYVVKSGLEEGMEIVVNGTFSIDAAAQLSGKPSMMNRSGSTMSTGHNHGEIKQPEKKQITNQTISNDAQLSVEKILKIYLELKDALIIDDFKNSKIITQKLLDQILKTDMNVFKGEYHAVWMSFQKGSVNNLKLIQSAKNIEEFRNHFLKLSELSIDLLKNTGPINQTLYIEFCPMADNNKGGYWISAQENILNPYFGDKMLTCGSVMETIKKQ